MHWKPALCQLYRRTLVPYLNQCRVDLTCRASGRRDSVNYWTRTDRLHQHRHVARRRTDKNAPKGQRMSSDLSGNYDRGTRRARLTPSLSETADFQRAPGDNADTARLRERIFVPHPRNLHRGRLGLGLGPGADLMVLGRWTFDFEGCRGSIPGRSAFR